MTSTTSATTATGESAARYVEAKPKQPQNQQHNKNSPKHIDLLCSVERFLKCAPRQLI